jgi:membrane associated rhomboid family serine protease
VTVAAGLALPVLWWRGSLGAEQVFLFVLALIFFCMFADTVEDRLGPLRFVVVYGAGHAVGTWLTLKLAPVAPLMVGLTSPAVAGMLGAYLALYPNSRVLVWTPIPLDAHEVPAIFFIAVFFILHLPGGAAALAPAGAGFAAGALTCLVLKRPMVW